MARRRWSFWMPPLEHRFIRRLDDGYRGSLTPAGRAVLWGLVASGVLRLGSLSVALNGVIGALASMLIGAVLLGALFRPRVSVRRRLPPPPSAGAQWSYEVTVTNTSSRQLRDIHLSERGLPAALRPVGKPSSIASLQPGESACVRLTLDCQQRGAYTLSGLQAASSFPSGLIKLGRRDRAAERILVYPAFERLVSFEVPMGLAHQPGGLPVASRVGESMELAGLREWRQGDRPRDVNWSAYARTGRMVVREYQQEHFSRLALVLDVEAERRADEVYFERGLSVAAAIADALARQEYIIDIFAAGDAVHHFQAGRSIAHFENILELLACLEPGRTLNPAALSAAILPAARRLSAVIFVMTDWDDTRRGLVAQMRSLGIAIRVVCVQPGVDVDGLMPGEVVVL
ncbi:MAG: DUF58 domain-containing protein [Myxococcota bacterium]|nr:DUF58 domain-containing protein [Myxococcota bacterium]